MKIHMGELAAAITVEIMILLALALASHLICVFGGTLSFYFYYHALGIMAHFYIWVRFRNIIITSVTICSR